MWDSRKNMLGIPTRSDVADPKYQRAVAAEDLRSKLEGFSWPTSTVFIHNHMLHPGSWDPEFVLNQYISQINNYRQNLEMGIAIGIVSTETEPHTSTAHPNYEYSMDGRTLKPLVRKRSMGIDDKLVIVTPVKKPFKHDPRDGFKIVYCPSGLAYHELEQYEAALKAAFASSSLKWRQLKRMRKVIEGFDKGAHKDLLSHSLVDPFNPPWPSSLEDKRGTEAYEKSRENKRIATLSDAYLRFDEFYVVFQKGKHVQSMIPAGALLNQVNPLNSNGFWNRQSIRDEVDGFMNTNGGFIFNGIPHTRRGNFYYVSGGAAPLKELVNVLGVPATNGQTIMPDEWAVQEVDMVRRARAGETEALHDFLDRYSGWGSDARTSSKKEKLDHVIYVLKRKEGIIAQAVDLGEIGGGSFTSF